MKYLTVRDIPSLLAEALAKEKRRRGTSLNQTVIDLLHASLGVEPAPRRSNGLARLAGTWSAEELERFTAAIAATEEIDAELWR